MVIFTSKNGDLVGFHQQNMWYFHIFCRQRTFPLSVNRINILLGTSPTTVVNHGCVSLLAMNIQGSQTDSMGFDSYPFGESWLARLGKMYIKIYYSFLWNMQMCFCVFTMIPLVSRFCPDWKNMAIPVYPIGSDKPKCQLREWTSSRNHRFSPHEIYLERKTTRKKQMVALPNNHLLLRD